MGVEANLKKKKQELVDKPLESLSDQEIITLLKDKRANESQVLEFLMDEYRRYLYSIMINKRVRKHDLDSIFVDCFFRFYKNVNKPDFILLKSIKNYLSGVLNNLIKEYFRELMKNRFEELLSALKISSKDNETKRGEQSDCLKQVIEKINQIKSPYREMLLLKSQGYSYKEMVPFFFDKNGERYQEHVIRQYVFRARRELHKKLGGLKCIGDFFND